MRSLTDSLTMTDTMQTMLASLLDTKPVAFQELVSLCRNPKHKPFGANGKILVEAGLIAKYRDSYIVHVDIAMVIDDCVSGEGLAMRID